MELNEVKETNTLARLQEVLKRVLNSPFYKSKLHGYPLSSITPETFSLLPMTYKSELREAGEQGILAVEQVEIAQYHESSGTTGIPSVSWFTHQDLIHGGSQLLHSDIHLCSQDLVLNRFPYALALPAHLVQQAARQVGAGVVPASGRNSITNYVKVLDLIAKLEVTVIASLPRELELLGEAARELGINVRSQFPKLRALWTAGELVTSARKRYLQDMWGVELYNFYGSTETGNMAFMCKKGNLHLEEQDYIFELSDISREQTVAETGKGLLIVTTLCLEGSPLVRYFNEDIVSLHSKECGCGRTGRIMVHHGRLKEARVSPKLITARDIHESVYSLNPVPSAWRCTFNDNELHFEMEWSEAAVHKEQVLESLESSLQNEIHLTVYSKGGMLNWNDILKQDSSTKPVYIRHSK